MRDPDDFSPDRAVINLSQRHVRHLRFLMATRLRLRPLYPPRQQFRQAIMTPSVDRHRHRRLARRFPSRARIDKVHQRTKVVSHGRYVTFQLAEVAVSRQMFAEILS